MSSTQETPRDPAREERSHFKKGSRVVPSLSVLTKHPRRSSWKGLILDFERWRGDTYVWVLWDKKKLPVRYKFQDLDLQGFEMPAGILREPKRYQIPLRHRPPVAPISLCPHGVPQPGTCHECPK